MHEHAGRLCLISLRASTAATLHAQCFMQGGPLVSMCALNVNGRSHPITRREVKNIATLHETMRTKAKTVKSSGPILLHSPLCTIHSVLILGIAFLKYVTSNYNITGRKVVTNATEFLGWDFLNSLKFLLAFTSPFRHCTSVLWLCFASAFLGYILISLVYIFFEGKEENYPNTACGPAKELSHTLCG